MLAALLIVAKLALCGVFIWAGAAKLGDLSGFRRSLQEFGTPATLVWPACLIVPTVELLTGAALLVPAVAWPAALAAGMLLVLFTAAIVANLLRGRRPTCHCFGQLSSERLGWKAVARNAFLLAAAGVLAWGGPENARSGTIGWLDEVHWGWQVLLVCLATLLLSLAARSGRVRSVLARPSAKALPMLDAQHGTGLPMGTPVPELQLFDRNGTEIGAEVMSRDGLPMLLVFLNHGCPSCAELKPMLGQWQRQYSSSLRIVVVLPWQDGGHADETPGAGPVAVLQRDRAATLALRAFITPSAVRIDAAGRIDSPLAIGPSRIQALLREALAAEPREPVTSIGGGHELPRNAGAG